MRAIWLCLLASAGPLTLLDELVTAPPGEWRPLSIALHQQPAVIECNFAVRRGPPVRLWLLDRGELRAFGSRAPVRPLAMTGYQRQGLLRHPAPKGDFVIIVDNRLDGRQSAEVRLLVRLDFASMQAWELPPERRRVVLLASLLFSLIVGWWAARHLGPKLWARLRE